MTSRSSKPSRGRALHPDEVQLWKAVTDTVVPASSRTDEMETFADMMRQHDVPQSPRPVDPATSGARPTGAKPVGNSHKSQVHSKSHPKLGGPALGTFEPRQSRQISRGHVEIDAVLDLHGLRQDEAHGALKRFLVQSQARGARYVTVITGKGRRVDRDEWGERERGVLRRVVRAWLEDADFRSLVVSYTTAPRNHGGEGALFVHVRRANKPRRR